MLSVRSPQLAKERKNITRQEQISNRENQQLDRQLELLWWGASEETDLGTSSLTIDQERDGDQIKRAQGRQQMQRNGRSISVNGKADGTRGGSSRGVCAAMGMRAFHAEKDEEEQDTTERRVALPEFRSNSCVLHHSRCFRKQRNPATSFRQSYL